MLIAGLLVSSQTGELLSRSVRSTLRCMSTLHETVQAVVFKAAALRAAGPAANEANTKAHLIEPILRALDWNLDDFAEVDREFKVFDGTFLDYALRVDGAPKLFVEAKALGKSLSDKQFIAQTVNYANNEGVVWCVLTNGLLFHVYKSNGPVVMDRKLLFEVDLQEAATPHGLTDVVASLESLRRGAVAEGQLDQWGESVFADVRIRQALAKVAVDPPKALLDAVGKAVDGPAMAPSRLRGSVMRLLDQLSAASTGNGALVGSPPLQTLGKADHEAQSPKASGSGAKKTFDVQHHTAKKPAAIRRPIRADRRLRHVPRARRFSPADKDVHRILRWEAIIRDRRTSKGQGLRVPFYSPRWCKSVGCAGATGCDWHRSLWHGRH